MANRGASLIGAVVGVLLIGLATVAPAEPPIRIGATLSQTDVHAAFGQGQLHGYKLCVEHVNEKGGVLGRKLELVVSDDGSNPAVAARLYAKLITQDKVDLILGPYSAPITEAVANVSEKHKLPMVAPGVGASSTVERGRKFVFMVLSRSEQFLEGFIELAARNGLKTIALIGEDSPFPRAAVKGGSDIARKRGLRVVFTGAYPRGITDFSTILTRIRATAPDAVAAVTYFEERWRSPAS